MKLFVNQEAVRRNALKALDIPMVLVSKRDWWCDGSVGVLVHEDTDDAEISALCKTMAVLGYLRTASAADRINMNGKRLVVFSDMLNSEV